MSKIKVTSKCEIYDGMSITFKAPCDCTAVDGLNVYYHEVPYHFSLRDAHGNDLARIPNLFTAGTYVKVILDTASGIAYIQNADSNAYLEARLDNVLKDDTKALYGLGPSAIPDDVFAIIGNYQQHFNGYCSDLYLFLTGQHLLVRMSRANNYDTLHFEATFRKMKESLTRNLELSGNKETITIYDGGNL